MVYIKGNMEDLCASKGAMHTLENNSWRRGIYLIWTTTREARENKCWRIVSRVERGFEGF